MRNTSFRPFSAAVALAALLPLQALALTFNVDTFIDLPDVNLADGICSYLAQPNPNIKSCSLRAAVMQANALPINNVNPVAIINLVPGEKYALAVEPKENDDIGASGDLDLKRPMRIGVPASASSMARIAAGGIDRIFDIRATAQGSVLYGLEITNASADAGVIKSDAHDVTVEWMNMHDNHCFGDGVGNGIWNFASMAIMDAEIHDNGHAGESDSVTGVVSNGPDAALTISSSSIYRNSASGILASQCTLVVSDSTITSNSVGLATSRSQVSIIRSTVAGNTLKQVVAELATHAAISASMIGKPGCAVVGETPAIATKYSIFKDSTCADSGTADATSVFDSHAELLPIADNGGLTMTRLPAVGGDGIDFVPGAFCDPDGLDQRGLPRAVNFTGAPTARCDAGAVELQGMEAPKPDAMFADQFESM